MLPAAVGELGLRQLVAEVWPHRGLWVQYWAVSGGWPGWPLLMPRGPLPLLTRAMLRTNGSAAAWRWLLTAERRQVTTMW